MGERGSIEILLLLCCLVGSVIFLCLAMAVAMLDDVPPPLDPSLQRRVAELEDLIASKERDLAQRESSGKDAERTQRELDALDRQRKELEARLAALQNEVAGLKGRTEEELRRQADAEKEAVSLRQQLDDLENRIRQKTLEREQAKAAPADADVRKRTDELKAQLKEAKDAEARLNAELGDLNSGVIDVTKTGGLSSFSRPLWVECTPDALELHPGGRIPLDKLVGNNPFVPALKDKHDVIKVFIRPGAFQTFTKEVLPRLNGPGIPVAYDPVEASVTLRFPDKVPP